MRILLIASSARGHAIADAIQRSQPSPTLFSIAPNLNPGLISLSEEFIHMPQPFKMDDIVEIAKRIAADLVIIGPEEPICAGLADKLEDVGIPTAAPQKALAQLESSKAFCREIISKVDPNISPKHKVFSKENEKDLNTYIEQELVGSLCVVKYDGLKGGKGVKVQGDHFETNKDGILYAKECISECGYVVIEEKLIGVEFSVLSFATGIPIKEEQNAKDSDVSLFHMPAVQDHKRAFEGDSGPNTGGMGTYSDANHSLPFLQSGDIEKAHEINHAVALTLLKEKGIPYKGILYGGYMATAQGIKCLEFNCRFGDPEALNILPLLQSNFVDILTGISTGEMSEDMVAFAPFATVCKVITPKSYPTSKDEKGERVIFPDVPENARIFFGDVSQDENGTIVLGGSRSAGIVGIGNAITNAEKIAQSLCEMVKGPIRFRSDIGTKDLIQKRVDVMKSLQEKKL